MTAKIKTVLRTKDTPLTAKYLLEGLSGAKLHYISMPHRTAIEIAKPGSLRRIVDRDPPKKPKRKMLRLYYFRDVHGLYSSFNRQEIDGLHDVRYQPGPIESAMVPEPRKKAGKTE